MNRDEQRTMITTESTNLENYWKRRNDQMLIDRDVINLVRPKAKTDESNWITNEPKVFLDTSRSLISLNEPRFRLPISINHPQEEKDRMNKAERLAIGIFRELNQRQVDRGGVSWLWDLAYWVLLGWYAVFNIIQKDPATKELKFIADLYDPMTVFPQWDANELVRCVRVIEVDRITAITMAQNLLTQIGEGQFVEPTNTGTQIKVQNYWRKTYDGKKPIVENAIMIDGQIVKPLTLQKKLDHIPIHIGAIGSPDRIIDDWMTRQGESCIASARDIFDYINVLIRLNVEIMAAEAYPNIWAKTRTGQPPVKDGQIKGHGEVITTRLEDQISLLKHTTSPQEVNWLMSYFVGQNKKATVADAVYGSMPFESSGFALSQLLASVKYKLNPYLNAMQSILSRVMTDFLYQYKKGKYSPITLSTMNPYDLKRGMTYFEEFSPEDVPERIFVEVSIPITSQFDKTQSILNAVQALNSGLMSRETLWESELDIQDSEQEKQRIREDQLFQDPFIRDIEIIEQMWQREDYYRNVRNDPVKADALRKYIMIKEMGLGMRKGIPQKVGQGVPPNQMPAEAGTSPTPDQTRATMEVPPPGLSRRAQTPEERSSSKGRKGILFSPSGEALI